MNLSCKIKNNIYILILSFFIVLALCKDNPFARQLQVEIQTQTPITVLLKYNTQYTNNIQNVQKIFKSKQIFLPEKIKDLTITLTEITDPTQKENIILKIDNENKTINTNNDVLYQTNDTIIGHRYVGTMIPFFIYFIIVYLFLFFAQSYNPPKREGKIVANINFLRIFFALLVSVEHLTYYVNQKFIPLFISFSECFIMISGFILFLTTNFETTSFKSYFTKRFIRLFPSYLFVVIIIFPFIADTYRLTVGDNSFLQTKFFMVLKISTIFSVIPKYELDILWAIPFFFWANCLLFGINKTFKEKSYFVLGILIYLFLYLYFTNNNSIMFHRYYILLVCLFMGYFIGVISKEYKFTDNKIIINCLELYVFGFVITTLFFNYNNVFEFFSIIYYLHVLALIYLFYQKKGIISNFFEKQIFTNLAKYTFAYYLIHEIVFTFIFEKYKIFKNINDWHISLALTISVLSSILLYHFIEKPFADKFKKK